MADVVLVISICSIVVLFVLYLLTWRLKKKKPYMKTKIKGGVNIRTQKYQDESLTDLVGFRKSKDTMIIQKKSKHQNMISSMRIRITEQQTQQTNEIIVKNNLIFGRYNKEGVADFYTVPNNMVSTRHCAIQIKDGQKMVCDFHSKNGTFVNGQPVTESIYVGERFLLTLGNVQLLIEIS